MSETVPPTDQIPTDQSPIDVEFFKRVGEAATAWFPTELFSIEPVSRARVNETFIVYVEDRRYILQALSREANPDGTQLMANQANIFKALRAAPDWTYQLPDPRPGPTGQTLLTYDDREWRMTDYIEETETLAATPKLTQVLAAAQAYGALGGVAITPELPRANAALFSVKHQWQSLISARQAAANEAPVHKEKKADDDAKRETIAALVGELEKRILSYPDPLSAGLPTQPLGLSHGDARLENLLFARREREQRDLDAWASETTAQSQASSTVTAMLDFDQAGVGYWWWDFGSLAAQLAVSKAGTFEDSVYAKLVEGFFASQLMPPTDAQPPTRQRAQTIDQAINATTQGSLLRCLRLLTDHLAGDRYYRVPEPGFNLAAASAEFDRLLVLEAPAVQQQQRELLNELL